MEKVSLYPIHRETADGGYKETLAYISNEGH